MNVRRNTNVVQEYVIAQSYTEILPVINHSGFHTVQHRDLFNTEAAFILILPRSSPGTTSTTSKTIFRRMLLHPPLLELQGSLHRSAASPQHAFWQPISNKAANTVNERQKPRVSPGHYMVGRGPLI